MNIYHITNPASERTLYILLIVLMTVSVIGSDMYIPSLPHIVSYFHSTPVSAKLTFTVYIIGFSFAQLFYGPLSDAYGRRPILLLGLSIALVGSILCVFSSSMNWLIASRLIQGIGIGVGTCIARSMAQDVFSGPKLGRIISYLSLMSGLAPAIAPVIGGYLQAYLGWRSVFIFITSYMLVTWLLALRLLPETNLFLDKHAIEIRQVSNNYKTLLTSPIFMGNVICGSCAIAGIFVYYTISPFLLQNTLHMSVVTYGWLAVFIAAAILLGRTLNVFFLKYWSAKITSAIGNLIMLVSGLLMVLLSFRFLSVPAIIVPIMFFVAGTGLVFANSAVAAFTPFKKMAGCAGALYTCLQTLGAFISTLIAAHLPTHNQVALGIFLTMLGLIAVFAHRLANNQYKILPIFELSKS